MHFSNFFLNVYDPKTISYYRLNEYKFLWFEKAKQQQQQEPIPKQKKRTLFLDKNKNKIRYFVYQKVIVVLIMGMMILWAFNKTNWKDNCVFWSCLAVSFGFFSFRFADGLFPRVKYQMNGFFQSVLSFAVSM